MSVPICFPPAHVFLLAPSEAAEVRPSPSRVFLNRACTVSQEGAPDGEGNSAGHEPAAPAGKGGGRERGYGILCDSWRPGGAGLRWDRMGGGGGRVATSSSLIWMHGRPLSPPRPDQRARLCYGHRDPRTPHREVVPLFCPRAESGETALLGDGPPDCLSRVTQGHFSRVVHGRSCIGLENLPISAPIRQKLGLNSASKMSLFLYHLAFCCN